MMELEEGGMFDEETLPDWMRSMRGVAHRGSRLPIKQQFPPQSDRTEEGEHAGDADDGKERRRIRERRSRSRSCSRGKKNKRRRGESSKSRGRSRDKRGKRRSRSREGDREDKKRRQEDEKSELERMEERKKKGMPPIKDGHLTGTFFLRFII